MRFWESVRVAGPDDCWEWTGGTSEGYGQVAVAGGHERAHRVSCVLHYGEIPPGLMVRHSCDNRLCVNQAHLLLGTARDNVMDMVDRGLHGQKRKTHCRQRHEYTPENTYVYFTQGRYDRPNVHRQCRTCARGWKRAHKAKAREGQR